MSEKLTHFNDQGHAHMVEISSKEDTLRIARAVGKISMNETAFRQVLEGTVKKGDVLGTARIAGIMGAKKTWELIPLCHQISMTGCEIEFEMDEKECSITAICTAKCVGKTGVEMEALTGVNVALLTIYDMCKAVDKEMVISEICLLEKDGGRSGHFVR